MSRDFAVLVRYSDPNGEFTAEVKVYEDDEVTLEWTDHVANDWKETHSHPALAIARLGHLIWVAEAGKLLSDDAAQFDQHAATLLKALSR